MANPYKDIELDALGMRALAHPVRLRLLGLLQRDGPSTATALAPLVGASPSVVSWHLRHLAGHGLVRESDPPVGEALDNRMRWWAAAARGFRLTAPTVDDSVDAYRALSHLLRDEADGLPARWAADVEPLLDREWLALAGLANTTVLVTSDELEAIERAIEQLLAPYVLRKDEADPPKDARLVRMLRYALPDAPTSDGPDGAPGGHTT